MKGDAQTIEMGGTTTTGGHESKVVIVIVTVIAAAVAEDHLPMTLIDAQLLLLLLRDVQITSHLLKNT